MPKKVSIIVAIDSGGTFTDFYVLGPEGCRTHKVLSTPKDPSRAILRGLKELKLRGDFQIIHGSTVATNALLEHKGAKVALLTTEGFEDVLEIGRQNRPTLYDLNTQRNPPLVPSRLRFGLPERIDAAGRILKKLETSSIKKIRSRLRSSGVESIAVCLLFSYANPRHEVKIRKALEGLGIPLSISSEICPEYREYERSSTTCLNAYVAPLMSRYLSRLAKRVRRPIRVMQSNGGKLSVAEAGREAVRTLLSGPAGGALGAFRHAREAGYEKVLTLDMGGTSTDMSLMDGALELTTEAQVGGYPVKTPMLHIETIGAGGGSLAWVDAGGALRVGPESAGADPGPLCYGKGGRRMTLTDAHVFLGRLPAKHLLGGTMALFPKKIRAPLASLARRLRLNPEATAEGMVQVANANMARALRVLSLQRGYDPREFTLLPFGGAGGLHACELADLLGIRQILLPKNPGILSADGMAHADWVRNDVKTVLAKPHEAGKLRGLLQKMKSRASKDARREGFPESKIKWKTELDLRYRGQSYELTVPFVQNFPSLFQKLHRRRYGFTHRGQPLEIVNLRLEARVSLSERPSPVRLRRPPSPPRGEGHTMRFECTQLFWRKKLFQAKIFLRENLRVGDKISGPAIISEYSATTFVPPDWKGKMDRFGNIILTHDI